MGATTFDALFGGALALEQSKDGYRFGIDSVLLGAGAPDADTMLDGGCGVGVVGLCALHLQPDARLQAVETQPQLAALAERNVERAGLGHRARVIVADLRSVELAPVDLVLLNPPFFPVRSGRRNPDPERDAARHEVYGTLPELCVAVHSHTLPAMSHRPLALSPRRFEHTDQVWFRSHPSSVWSITQSEQVGFSLPQGYSRLPPFDASASHSCSVGNRPPYQAQNCSAPS